jgi:hypothetical protein
MLLTAACLFGLFAFISHGSDEASILMALAVGVIAAGAHLWLALSIRCPACQRRIGWLVLSGMHASQWLVQLWRGERCPSCGDTGVAPGALARPEPQRD